jgi:uncharacterized protein involved in exopolysaccharide biosynthesis
VDHLELFASLRQQIAAALAALPHDYDEAAQRLQAVQDQLAALESEGERDLEAMARWYDDGGNVRADGRAA